MTARTKRYTAMVGGKPVVVTVPDIDTAGERLKTAERLIQQVLTASQKGGRLMPTLVERLRRFLAEG
jgi:hypothetical protein